jgi:glucose/mannose-6-phosphate isomerase
MGGSAIAGDLLAAWAAAGGLRLAVWRDYDLPGWVDARTPVILSSYSGYTEETLSAARAAAARGCPLYAITSGGELGDYARAGIDDGPPFPRVALPGGLPPRAALGHGLGALARLLGRLDLLAGVDAELAAAAAALRDGVARLGPASGPDSPAKAAARTALGRMLVVYTTSPESHAAGQRLKAQVNENGKSPALVVPFPELDHNDIVGWEVLRPRRDDFVLLLLRSTDETARAALRTDVTCELLAGEFHTILEFRAVGETTLARTLSLVQYGDYLSCYLAEAAGVDPVPVSRIDVLKQRLQAQDG